MRRAAMVEKRNQIVRPLEAVRDPLIALAIMPIAGRGCVGSDTKHLCRHFCCRTGSTPRHRDTLFPFRGGGKRTPFIALQTPDPVFTAYQPRIAATQATLAP